MKPFRFRLETLLGFRKMKKEQSQIAFLQAKNQLRIEKEVLQQMEGKLSENIELLQIRKQQTLEIEVFKSFQYYFDKLGVDIAKQKQIIVEATTHYQECLAALTEAEKNYRVVEKFREKKVMDYQIETMQEEQKMLDEIGLQVYTRKK